MFTYLSNQWLFPCSTLHDFQALEVSTQIVILFFSMTRKPTSHSLPEVKVYVSLLGLHVLLFYFQISFICVGGAGLFIQTGCPESSKIISQPSQHSKAFKYEVKSHDMVILLEI